MSAPAAIDPAASRADRLARILTGTPQSVTLLAMRPCWAERTVRGAADALVRAGVAAWGTRRIGGEAVKGLRLSADRPRAPEIAPLPVPVPDVAVLPVSVPAPAASAAVKAALKAAQPARLATETDGTERRAAIEAAESPVVAAPGVEARWAAALGGRRFEDAPDRDAEGRFVPPRQTPVAAPGRSVTAAAMGDPAPGRSAWDQRTQGAGR